MDLFEKCPLSIWPMQPLYPLTASAVCCTDWFWIWKRNPYNTWMFLPYLYYSLSSLQEQPSSSSPWSMSTHCTSQVPVEITSLFLVTLWLHSLFLRNSLIFRRALRHKLPEDHVLTFKALPCSALDLSYKCPLKRWFIEMWKMGKLHLYRLLRTLTNWAKYFWSPHCCEE